MKRPWASAVAVVALLAGAALLRMSSAPGPTSPAGPAPARPEPAAAAPASRVTTVVPGVTVLDLDGRVAWRGDVDLAPVLARIGRGERDPHRGDGAVFQNREGRLPRRPAGHYREYVVRTPGLASVGPQRLVLGGDGEVFYTPDHYRTFTRIEVLP